MKIRVTSIILCLFILLSTFVAGCGEAATSSTPTDANSSSSEEPTSSQESSVPTASSGAIDSFVKYSPLTASGDGLLDSNPDRGFRTEMVLRIDKSRATSKTNDARTVFADESDEQIRATMEKYFDSYFKTEVTTNKMFLAYIYFTDYHNTDLSAGAIRALKIFFDICRERKVKSMLRFCYNWSYAKNYKLANNKELLATECADQKTILKHIQQLKPVISEYADTIHTISNGFVGYVGEWAYSYQYPHVDYPTIIKAIVENLCVPNGLYFSNRDPEYLNELIDEEPNYKYLKYISHNNDAMFGEQSNKDWYSGNMQLGTPEWQQVIDDGAYTPQDGEMFTIGALVDTANGRTYNPRIPTGMQMILECAHHWHTSMSNWHAYVEAISPNHKYYKDNIMLKWQEQTLTKDMLDREKILYDPNWFVDDNGNAVKRNPYDFIKDHLGYKLVAINGHITGNMEKGSKVTFDLTLKNYGFAAAFMLESGYAILDENYKVISTVKAGSPDKWYSHDPENYKSNTALEYSVKADLNVPETSGKYYIAFYLKNTMDDRARLSNNISFKEGYNILYSFDV